MPTWIWCWTWLRPLGVFGVDGESITQGVLQMTISEVMGNRGV